MPYIERVVDLSVVLGKGVYSVGEDIVFGMQRTAQGLGAGQDGRMAEIGYENRITFDVLTNLVKYPIHHPDNPLYQLTVTVLENYYDKFPDSALDYVAKQAGVGAAYMTGRMVIGRAIAVAIGARIAVAIASTAAYKEICRRIGMAAGVGKTGIGIPVSLLMFQGIFQRSSRAAKRLQIRTPRLHAKLEKKDLQVLYFLVEKAFADYIDAIEIADRSLELFQSTILKKYGLEK